MPNLSSSFSSVKLPAALVQQAREVEKTRVVERLTSRLLAAQVSGSLAQRVREVVEENHQQAQ